jgi:hypothetical protein
MDTRWQVEALLLSCAVLSEAEVQHEDERQVVEALLLSCAVLSEAEVQHEDERQVVEAWLLFLRKKKRDFCVYEINFAAIIINISRHLTYCVIKIKITSKRL